MPRTSLIPHAKPWIPIRRNFAVDDDTVMRSIPYFGDDALGVSLDGYDAVSSSTVLDLTDKELPKLVSECLHKFGAYDMDSVFSSLSYTSHTKGKTHFLSSRIASVFGITTDFVKEMHESLGKLTDSSVEVQLDLEGSVILRPLLSEKEAPKETPNETSESMHALFCRMCFRCDLLCFDFHFSFLPF